MEYTCKDAIEMLSDVATVVIAGLGLIYAIRTFRIAREAKDEWINQRKFDYKVTVDSLLSDYLTAINDVYYYRFNYTHVFLRGRGDFTYRGSVVDVISKSKEYVDNAVKYVNHSIYSKSVHGEKLSQIYEKLHPAIVGLNDHKLKEIFYNIEEFKRQYDWQVENSRKMIAFLIDCYNQKGTIDIPIVNATLDKTKDFIDNTDYEKELKKIRIAVKAYLKS